MWWHLSTNIYTMASMPIQRLLILALLLTIGVRAVYGCECSIEKHKANFRSAKQIFFGEVISIGDSKTLNLEFSNAPLHSVTFKVEKVWKGRKTDEIVVVTDSCASMCCTVQFHEGGKYLVYVYDDSSLPSDCSLSSDENAP
jgi:hypothetical protein